jgi:NAD(P)-dependent dehydrogenase (short-subunit alcohol dehydrogenase family)
MSSHVVVVRRASGGIGRAAARAFGERGDRVALIARARSGWRRRPRRCARQAVRRWCCPWTSLITALSLDLMMPRDSGTI